MLQIQTEFFLTSYSYASFTRQLLNKKKKTRQLFLNVKCNLFIRIIWRIRESAGLLIGISKRTQVYKFVFYIQLRIEQWRDGDFPMDQLADKPNTRKENLKSPLHVLPLDRSLTHYQY